MEEENKAESNKIGPNKIVELFDWIINTKMLRGSKKDDQGMWMNNSEKPKYFCANTRIVELDDGKQFLIKKETSCNALNLSKSSEKLLTSLPTIKKYNTL
jgi:hypothetical protein